MHRILYLGNRISIAQYLYSQPNIQLIGCVFEDEEDIDEFQRFHRKTGVETFRVTSKFDLSPILEDLQPIDLGIMSNFGIILTPWHFSQSKGGFVNIHPGLLPNNAGRNPVLKAIEEKHHISGITIHHVTNKIDQGPQIAHEKIDISDIHDPKKLMDILYEFVPKLLDKNLPKLLP